MTRPPVALFLGVTYAGHAARFRNLERYLECDGRVQGLVRPVDGWRANGVIERLPFLPSGMKGRMRSIVAAAPAARLPRPDVIWTSAGEIALPYLLPWPPRFRPPLVLDTDWTLEQQEELAPIYFRRAPLRIWRRRILEARERALWSRVSLFLPWSRWAADSLIRQGVPPDRVRVLPPGVDLEQWDAPPRLPRATDEPLRVLFVGGDFLRKGGDLLLEAVRARPGRFELDIVTRDAVSGAPGIRVHHAEPGSGKLRALYRQADLFALPTRAEAFGIAATEAMASGLPVIMGDVGAAREIVDDGETGWLVEPALEPLLVALDRADASRTQLPALGARARRTAEERFDSTRNNALLVNLLLELVNRSRGASTKRWSPRGFA